MSLINRTSIDAAMDKWITGESEKKGIAIGECCCCVDNIHEGDKYYIDDVFNKIVCKFCLDNYMDDVFDDMKLTDKLSRLEIRKVN